MIKRIGVILFACLICLSAKSATSADEILQQTINKYFSSDGIEASYTIMSNNASNKGTIKLHGKKFVILNSYLSTWYDGKTQWTYNSSTNETTIIEPSQEELNSINPYNIIMDYKNNFTSTIVNSKIGGTYCVVLKPKINNAEIKKIVLYIKSTDYNLVRADLTNEHNIVTTLILSNIKRGQTFKQTDFTYPQNKLKQSVIIDLR